MSGVPDENQGAGLDQNQGADAPRSARRLWIGVGCVVLAVIGAGVWFAFVREPDTGDDMSRLQGEWRVGLDGRDGAEPAAPLVARVSGDRWVYVAGGRETRTYQMSINPAVKPGEIDLVQLDANGQPAFFTHGPSKGSPVGLRGVYEFDGRTVRVAFVPTPEERPRSFDATDGQQVLVLRR